MADQEFQVEYKGKTYTYTVTITGQGPIYQSISVGVLGCKPDLDAYGAGHYSIETMPISARAIAREIIGRADADGDLD